VRCWYRTQARRRAYSRQVCALSRTQSACSVKFVALSYAESELRGCCWGDSVAAGTWPTRPTGLREATPLAGLSVTGRHRRSIPGSHLPLSPRPPINAARPAAWAAGRLASQRPPASPRAPCVLPTSAGLPSRERLLAQDQAFQTPGLMCTDACREGSKNAVICAVTCMRHLRAAVLLLLAARSAICHGRSLIMSHTSEH
jgi:hypothetical protein